MTQYKSSANRLARWFKRSRDNWKKRSQAKQKQIRALETKVRDLSQSQNHWKEKARQAEQELAELKKQLLAKTAEQPPQKEAKVGSNGSGETEWHQIKGHHYPAEVVQLGLEQVTNSLNSLRGSEKTFNLFSPYCELEAPSYNSIRSWLLRVGLYELNQRPVYDEDWIMLLDATLELGTLKCLGILGIPVSRLAETGYALKHHDVDLLALVVLASCTGEVIDEELEKVSHQQKRPPLQIVSDYGSDVKKGVKLYQQKHPQLIWTHDVTHAMALLLKQELKDDETFQTFMKQCNLTRQQIKQTPLYFLCPPKQRSKARYLHIESHIRWAQQLLQYQDQNDFSAIKPDYHLDETALTRLQTQLDPETLTLLTSLDPKTYPNRTTFCQQLRQKLGAERWAEYEAVLCQAADLGQRYFEEKLGWVSAYRSVLPTYAQMSSLVNTVAQQLKQNGLNHTAPASFVKETTACSLSPRLERFKNYILAYLQNHTSALPLNQTLLASSDVLESIFGKYKLFSAERSFKEIGQMVLTIPLFTTKLTPQRVKLALESIRMVDVQAWAKQTFGQSMLSKRRSLFNFDLTQIVREKSS